jgi:histone acetyltransferase (RNA polymerase elongator complex component)
VDDVLIASRRGHSAADVARAVGLLQEANFEVGLHLMVGLPGDSRDAFERSVDLAVALAPHMVRIHPTLVFRDTPLAEDFYRGDYTPLSMEEALDACKYAAKRFEAAGIPIIRLGLQTTREMEQPGAVVAGPFHPAFGALVESSAFLDQASAMLRTRDVKRKRVIFYVPSRKESAFRGQHNENLRILSERFDLAGIQVRKGAVLEVSL